MPVQDGLPARERTRALVVILLGILMAVLDGTIVNLALPDITRELNASAAQSIWVINAYQIATLALLLPLATLGDIVGYRRVYLVGMAVFVTASMACALASSLTALTLARVLQGLSAAGIMSVNTALVRRIYPRHLLGRAIAINSLVVATASVAGPTIAAGILSVASWPWLFAINIPLGLLSLMLGRSALPQNPAKTSGARFSALDVVLNALMFGLVLLGIDGLGVRVESTPGGGAHGTPLWLALAELAAGLAVGAVYVRRQLGRAGAAIPAACWGRGFGPAVFGLAAAGRFARSAVQRRHRLAHGPVRRWLWRVSVAQQPHHHHVGTGASQRRRQRHAGHRAPDRPDTGRRAARHHLQLF